MKHLLNPILAQQWTPAGLQIAGRTISTKTLGGWALGIVLIVLVIGAINTIKDAKKEHDAGERNEKVKFAIISVIAGVAVVAVLDWMGIITFTEISSGLSSL